jgi:hypothetical protein
MVCFRAAILLEFLDANVLKKAECDQIQIFSRSTS